MQIPGLNYLKDKWVWIGLVAGAGVYLFTNQHHPSPPMIHHMKKPGGYSLTDRPGLYEVPNKGFENMRFSGQAELQRRLTVV